MQLLAWGEQEGQGTHPLPFPSLRSPNGPIGQNPCGTWIEQHRGSAAPTLGRTVFTESVHPRTDHA